jgi:hypothetical protein
VGILYHEKHQLQRTIRRRLESTSALGDGLSLVQAVQEFFLNPDGEKLVDVLPARMTHKSLTTINFEHFLLFGDVTQWQSGRFACDKSGVRFPSSPNFSFLF